MDITIQNKFEGKRGCGYRKEGGYYLVGTARISKCDLLPVPLEICPACYNGIKFSRGFTWINPGALFPEKKCACTDSCPLEFGQQVQGLLWVGERFYPTPNHFIDESSKLGISKRLRTIPHRFELGYTWIFLAHKKAIDNERPGIFYCYRPTSIEYIVGENDTHEDLGKLVKRGIDLIKVIRQGPEVDFLEEICLKGEEQITIFDEIESNHDE